MEHSRSTHPERATGLKSVAKGHLGRLFGALATACMLWQPLPALAEEAVSDDPAIEAQDRWYDSDPYYDRRYDSSYYSNSYSRDIYDISYFTIKVSNTSQPYTGSEIKPTVEVYYPRYYNNSNDYYYDYRDWTRYNNYYWYYDGSKWYIDIDDDGYHNDSYEIYYDSYDGRYYYSYNGSRYFITLPSYSRSDSYNYSSSYSDLYLREGSDYYVTYSNNINPGTATITVHGRSPYYGTKSTTFTITGTGYTNSSAIRLSGATRYDTMSTIVNEGFRPVTAEAVVACGNNFPDALAASSLAGSHGAPVILTDSNSLASQAANQLSRLGVRHVYLMGETAALSPAVESAITNMGITTTRIAGADRIETSLRAFEETRNANTANISNTVIIATGYNFADSLSIGPWAYAYRTPIVLTQSDGTLSAEAVNAIKGDPTKSNVIIVGGTAVVSDSVKDQLGNIYHYTRLSGANRYETSRAIADWETSNGFGWQMPIVATGNNFPDALAGSALGGATRSPLLLVSSASDATVSAMSTHRGTISKFYVLGGEGAVSTSLTNAIASTVRR